MSQQNFGPNSLSSAKEPAEDGTSFVDKGAPLPEAYGQTYIVLMPRDPQWMFSYWEITPQTLQNLQSEYGAQTIARAQATIRMHEAALHQGQPKSIRFYDVSISFDAKNWYLHSPLEGASWFIEIGLKTADGKFIVIAKSKLVTLPMGSVSMAMDEQWVTLKDDLEKILAASGGAKLGESSMELSLMLRQRWQMLTQISSWKGKGGSSLSRCR